VRRVSRAPTGGANVCSSFSLYPGPIICSSSHAPLRQPSAKGSRLPLLRPIDPASVVAHARMIRSRHSPMAQHEQDAQRQEHQVVHVAEQRDRVRDKIDRAQRERDHAHCERLRAPLHAGIAACEARGGNVVESRENARFWTAPSGKIMPRPSVPHASQSTGTGIFKGGPHRRLEDEPILATKHARSRRVSRNPRFQMIVDTPRDPRHPLAGLSATGGDHPRAPLHLNGADRAN